MKAALHSCVVEWVEGEGEREVEWMDEEQLNSGIGQSENPLQQQEWGLEQRMSDVGRHNMSAHRRSMLG